MPEQNPKYYYVIVLQAGVDPQQFGPYSTNEKMDKDAKAIYNDRDRFRAEYDSIFGLNVNLDHTIDVFNFSAAYFEEE